MAIKDIKSNLTTYYTDFVTISPSTTIETTSVDVRAYNNGVMVVILPVQSDTVDNEISLEAIQESSDDIDFNNIDDELYIGDIAHLQNLEIFTPPTVVPTLGCFGSQKFLRCQISSGANTGDMTLAIVWILASEIKPDPNDPTAEILTLANLIDGLGNDVLDGLGDQIVVNI